MHSLFQRSSAEFRMTGYGEFIRNDINTRGRILMKKLIKNLIKWGPLLYPVVKKVLDEKKKKEAYERRGTAR